MGYRLEEEREEISLWYGARKSDIRVIVYPEVKIINRRGYFYDDELIPLAEALMRARARRESKRVSIRKKIDHITGDKREHHGIGVTLSVNETIGTLKTYPIEGGKIFYWGDWLPIVKTDLKDDVRLCIGDYDRSSLCGMVKYGARIDHAFCIIASYSDG